MRRTVLNTQRLLRARAPSSRHALAPAFAHDAFSARAPTLRPVASLPRYRAPAARFARQRRGTRLVRGWAGAARRLPRRCRRRGAGHGGDAATGRSRAAWTSTIYARSRYAHDPTTRNCAASQRTRGVEVPHASQRRTRRKRSSRSRCSLVLIVPTCSHRQLASTSSCNRGRWSPTRYADGAKTRGNAGVVSVSCLVFDLARVPPDPERLASVCWMGHAIVAVARRTWRR
jgi:hypothetical protein